VPGDLLLLTLPVIKIRRGRQLRLVIPGAETPKPIVGNRDEKLVSLIAEAHQAKQLLLANRARSISSIAADHGRRTRLGKLVALSCLAPDIVIAIIEGRQLPSLTARAQLISELPLAWTDQRRALGFV